MSLDQYKRFYWPGLQQLLVALAEQDLNPFVFVEGGSNSRLETMADVPAGKVCYWFDHVDMRRAKEVVGGKACIAGNVPISLLTVGTPDNVRAYCKDLIDSVGRDGGFIMGSSGQTEDVEWRANDGGASVNTVDIDFAACDGCKICYKACFVDVFRWDESTKRPIVAYPEDCVQCNLCELNCRPEAIKVIVDWDKPFPSVLERGGRYPE